ncbi:hypothetical protein L682_31045 [Aquipseudomonas alcaligenes OT 69]|nr:hypothetical protein L682_31045 [Pseudomonas alcaligenes OT 69]
MSTAKQEDTFSQFLGEPIPVPIRAPGFMIYLIEVEQVGEVSRLIAGMRDEFDAVAAELDASRKAGADTVTMFERALERVDILDLIERHKPELYALLALLTRRPVEDVARLGLDDFLGLLLALVEVNLDFFYLRLRPQLRANLVRLAAAISLKQPNA